MRGIVLGLILFGGLYGNIVAHEMGHWLVANELNLDPKIHLFESPENGTRSFFNQNFFTTYNADSVKNDMFVAFAGPMINLIIALGLIALYFTIPKQKKYIRLIVIMLIIPAILSFVSNIIPTAGSDGFVMLQNWR
jgi:membrane-associated protease RseP (regulator of RpoE activity)